jgi:hypothetical protein
MPDINTTQLKYLSAAHLRNPRGVDFWQLTTRELWIKLQIAQGHYKLNPDGTLKVNEDNGMPSEQNPKVDGQYPWVEASVAKLLIRSGILNSYNFGHKAETILKAQAKQPDYFGSLSGLALLFFTDKQGIDFNVIGNEGTDFHDQVKTYHKINNNKLTSDIEIYGTRTQYKTIQKDSLSVSLNNKEVHVYYKDTSWSQHKLIYKLASQTESKYDASTNTRTMSIARTDISTLQKILKQYTTFKNNNIDLVHIDYTTKNQNAAALVPGKTIEIAGRNYIWRVMTHVLGNDSWDKYSRGKESTSESVKNARKVAIVQKALTDNNSIELLFNSISNASITLDSIESKINTAITGSKLIVTISTLATRTGIQYKNITIKDTVTGEIIGYIAVYAHQL